MKSALVAWGPRDYEGSPSEPSRGSSFQVVRLESSMSR
jgi:hypothetical protein